MTLDIWHLKVIVRKFRKSRHVWWFHICANMIFDKKKKNRQCFLHAKSTVLHTPKGKTGAFENGSIPEA